MADLLSNLTVFTISGAVLALIVVALYLVHRRLLSMYSEKPQEQYKRQMIMLGLSLVGLVLCIIVVPIGDEMRGQLLGLIGILLSATIALSSTTLVGNVMAGLMLRSLGKIGVGSYITVGEHFGRVSQSDLLHTEIQTEDRDLTTLPNLYLVTNPVKVMRSSGTVVSVEVSLGYNVQRAVVEPLLLKAAKDSGLDEPFVQITDLGDFAVTYRIAGVAEDLGQLLATRRRLRSATLDALHGGGVEIVSPTFMNQRVLDANARFVPVGGRKQEAEETGPAPDAVVFDKAEVAASLEALRAEQNELNQKIAEIDESLDSMDDDKARRSAIFQKKKALAQLARLEKQIYSAEAEIAEE